ncbi:MAG: ATP-binding protein [Marivita sp.]|uniref:ATP-binding protein n=1 Tax=Marivita sp. TaxID=2003365 RepID=UPI003EF216E2
MLKLQKSPMRAQIMIWLVLAMVGFVAIVFMSVNVARDLRLLNSANSDNVQWSLSQAEVEFLEYELHLFQAVQEDRPRLRDLRRRFDIFYSRIDTLRDSAIYEGLRGQDEFASNLGLIHAFLLRSIADIDSQDADLTEALPQLLESADRIRANVRALSNSGLNYFAENSDMRRSNVAITLTQMAAVVTLLLLALLCLSIYLNYLNGVNLRRRTEAIEAGKRMKIVTGTALDAVIVSDSEGRILDFNAAAEHIFGYSAAFAIGRNLADLIIPDHHFDAHNAGMDRMRHGGEKRVVGKGRVKLDAKRASGKVFPVELAIQTAETDEGNVFIAFLRDISHRVQAEQDLVAARDRALAGEKAKTDFLATMSHEIRTPLNGLLGNLSLLRDTKLTAKQARYIKNMDTSGKLLMSHISDVLDITKYDAGMLRIRPVAMNISTLLQDIIDNQSGAASANDTSLQWGWEGPSTDWVMADRDRLQHVLMNIIGNAVKFTRGGNVKVVATTNDAQREAPRLKISVSDTGVGIDPQIMAQIFDDFMTGDSSYDRDVGGTGLGLGIAQRFVKALGGTIEVASEPGKGSTFDIHLPIVPVAAPLVIEKQQTDAVTGKTSHILLVEDNEINRVVAREMLIAAGHRVTEAHNGRIAVDLAHEQEFALILMDISMPVLDGRGATREIRSGKGASATTPIVALTANAMADEQQAYLVDGMNDILTKPLTREALLQIVSDQVGLPTKAKPGVPEIKNVVALSYIEELRDGLGVTALQVFLERFVNEVDETLDALRDFEALGLAETAACAHKISGSAATMGAVELRSALIRVENAAKQGDLEATRTALGALPHVWSVTRPLMLAERQKCESMASND